MFSSISFIYLDFRRRPIVYPIMFLYGGRQGLEDHYIFPCGYPVVLAYLVEKKALSPLNCFHTSNLLYIFEYQMTVYV